LNEKEERKVDYPGAFLSTLGLTLANPPTILAFVAIFAGLGLVASDYASASLVVLGVFLGSASWWLLLAAGAGRLRAHVGPRLFRAINVVSGCTILAFAAWQLAAVLR
jgi:arginine exporter protein ArgO